MYLILSHGRGGSPNGVLMVPMAEVAKNYPIEVIRVNDEDITHEPEKRANRLIELVQSLPSEEEVILAGFSMGGFCSVCAAEVCQNVRGLFLIAPALYLPHYPARKYRDDLINVEIIHGWSDDTVIYEHSLRYAKALNATLHLIAGNHVIRSQAFRVKEIFDNYLNRIFNKAK